MTKLIILIVGVIGIFSFSSLAFSDNSLPSVTPSCAEDEGARSSQEGKSVSVQDEPVQERDESVVEPDEELEPSDQKEVTEEKEEAYIADPLAPWNKAMYHVNDKFYYWLLKPTAQGYSAVFPEGMRVSFSNFYENVATPIRFVNNLLQLKIKSAGNELVRFVANTLFGVVGFGDFAKEKMDIKRQDEDLGQTFAHYGIGHGFYIVWPILGPSSLRDSIGFVGDRFLHPFGYVSPTNISFGAAAGLYAHEKVNDTSFHIGDYEDLTKAAIDPYVSIRDAYVQHRQAYP
jgi:phospholipid-binding lipoprotein MlaA